MRSVFLNTHASKLYVTQVGRGRQQGARAQSLLEGLYLACAGARLSFLLSHAEALCGGEWWSVFACCRSSPRTRILVAIALSLSLGYNLRGRGKRRLPQGAASVSPAWQRRLGLQAAPLLLCEMSEEAERKRRPPFPRLHHGCRPGSS